eukprot:gnl/Spiro4/4409_TR2185_c0_g2_i1.p1 gnl/Spiro4/4409_TR2185_c0_g2~~gnl/Spiro4/4409_TR2185_c0_g2_i1.p1  ORF type:complete len:619 (-),score=189.37 gnl/Spiro4/4409_TR2185_c0_g2_i1:17-1846(-)
MAMGLPVWVLLFFCVLAVCGKAPRHLRRSAYGYAERNENQNEGTMYLTNLLDCDLHFSRTVSVRRDPNFPLEKGAAYSLLRTPDYFQSYGPKKVKPGSRVAFMHTNRNTGITNGEFYLLKTEVWSDAHPDEKVQLVQKLEGWFSSSQLWYTAYSDLEKSGGKLETDRELHEFPFQPFLVTAQSQFATGSGHDHVNYVVHPNPDAVHDSLLDALKDGKNTPKAAANVLDVLSYNIYELPDIAANTAQLCRSKLIPGAVGPYYDVVALQEVFNPKAKNNVPPLMKDLGYTVTVPVGDTPCLNDGMQLVGGCLNGGVQVFVHGTHEVQDEGEFHYGKCAGHDCSAAKGVKYVKFRKGGKKNGQVYHVFATHTQASYSDEDADGPAVRAVQFKHFRRFIQSKKIRSDEPVLLLGDMNVIAGTKEHGAMKTALAATDVQLIGSSLKFSLDPANPYVPNEETPQLLDYVMYSTEHLVPLAAAARVVPIVSHTPCSDGALNELFAKYAMSDHYAIHASLKFDDDPEPADEDEEVVVPQPKAGEDFAPCENHSDCKSGACGLEYSSDKYVCCWPLSYLYNSYTHCYGYPPGHACGTNSMCDSGLCTDNKCAKNSAGG